MSFKLVIEAQWKAIRKWVKANDIPHIFMMTLGLLLLFATFIVVAIHI